jgi:iron complex transport system substrate-binding protein
MRSGLQRISTAVAGRPRPRVFITVARQPGSLANILTASRGTFVHEIIEYAGGENVFADLAMAYPQVSLEAILAAQPDVIIEAMPEIEPTEALAASVRELWAKLGPLPAVKNNRVYLLTEPNALTPSPRVVEVVGHVARWLHPEVEDGGE